MPNDPFAHQALHDRYRDPNFARLAIWNDTLAALLAHRSVRAYLPAALPNGTLEALIAAAQSTATSANAQAWSVISIDDPAKRAAVNVLAGNQAQIAHAPLFLVWIADLSRASRAAEAQSRTLDGADYLESFLVAVIDVALAAQSATAAAESLGLGTCYIGAIRNHPEALATELNLPPHTFATFGLCVGYPDPAKPASVKPRLPQSAVLHRNTYTIDGEPEALATYDQRFADFQREQNQTPAGWTARLIDRFATAAALGGRDQLRQAIERLGFKLR